jgi:hypothetical protein
VYQFARDAAVAEAWLIAQEPYLMSQELGVSCYFLSLSFSVVVKLKFSHYRPLGIWKVKASGFS